MNEIWKSAKIPPPHRKDVLLQERESKILYVGHYNEYTEKYIFIDFPIDVEYWTELPPTCDGDG